MADAKVGVSVIIIKDNKFLIGKRKGSHGKGTWGFPGGHLEFMESIEECAKREVLEETGLQIKILKRGPYTNDIFKEANKHYATLFVVAEIVSGELKIMEPNKCEEWKWFSWDEFPEPIFLPMKNLRKTNYNPFS